MSSKPVPASNADRSSDMSLVADLVRLGLASAGDRPRIMPLEGGVSSDIVRVDLATGPVCVKRALPRLKVAAIWEAPIERNAAEADWFRVAAEIVPNAVPKVLAEDRAAGLFVMDYLDPDDYPVWKQQLRDGAIDSGMAGEVGARLAAIHAATAGRSDVAERFANDDIFHAIRLEPYLVATGVAHPRYAGILKRLAETTAATKKALVHGDVSPKNILAGPDGPVFLDAECATYGDPAFDLAFCLNHLLLKCVWRPRWTEKYLACFDQLSAAYRAGVKWELPAELERRSTLLLAGLLLARIDGKSPVEYITMEEDKKRVRTFAFTALDRLPAGLDDLRDNWRSGLAA